MIISNSLENVSVKPNLPFFILSMYSLLPKDLTIKHLFIFTEAGVVSCGDRKKSHCSLL